MQTHSVNEYTGELIDKPLRWQASPIFFNNQQPCLIGIRTDKVGAHGSFAANPIR
ncbi:hypothetical protein [Xenorhabdus sp. TH1]|uniref:hypothetical protein n=1 Tax=Xenorhabdus sp. TH1 TaxID=3130166 RepID=UPI0030CF3EE8